MLNFTYYIPTKIVFGKETENQVGELVREQGCKKVLVHYGSNSAKKSGLLDRVYASLDAAGVEYVSLGGVVPNPRLSLAREGIELCRKEGVDFILAVGGGSVIDSSKCIGHGLANPEDDVWDYHIKKKAPKACAPIGVILTISAAGSETSNSSVITNEDGWLKRGCSSEYSRPKFAIMNPELTYTLPAYQTASGATDILMHTLERYLQQKERPLSITTGMAEALLKNVMKFAPVAVENPEDYESHAEIMWSGSLSHVDLMHLGAYRGDWSCHALEHELGGMFDVAHGAGLAAVWPSWARYVLDDGLPYFTALATNVMGVEHTGDDRETALAGISVFEDFLHSIGMPTTIGELGIEPTEEQILEMADKCSAGGTKTIGGDGIRALDKSDIEAIFRAAL